MENTARSLSPESSAACWGSDLDNGNLTDNAWQPVDGHTGLMSDPTVLHQQLPVDLEFRHFHLSSAPTPFPPHADDQVGDQHQSHPRSYSASTYSYTYVNNTYTSDVQHAAASSSSPDKNDSVTTYASGTADHRTDGPPRTNGVSGRKRRRAKSDEDESEPRTMPAMPGTHTHDPAEHGNLAYAQGSSDPAYSYSPPESEQRSEGGERHSQRRRRVYRAIAQVDEELGGRRRSSQGDS